MSSTNQPLFPHFATDASAQLAAYTHAYAALQECLTVQSVTSVSYALRAWIVGEQITETISHVRTQLSLLPVQLCAEAEVFAGCVQLRSIISILLHSFAQHDLTSYIERVQGGTLFLASICRLHELASQLPSLADAGDLPEPCWNTCFFHDEQVKRYSVISKENEYEPLRAEIVEQVKLQQSYVLAIFTVSSLFLLVGLQPGISGLVVLLEPVVGLGIAMKIAAHDLRVGQLNLYLRSVLRSTWEIWRRSTFNGVAINDAERLVLAEQHIDVTTTGKKHLLTPRVANMQALANRWVFMANYLAALGIGVIRTYPQAFHFDLLTIFVWLCSFSTAACTWVVLQRRRVR